MNPDRNDFRPNTEQPPETGGDNEALYSTVLALLEGADAWLALLWPADDPLRKDVERAKGKVQVYALTDPDVLSHVDAMLNRYEELPVRGDRPDSEERASLRDDLLELAERYGGTIAGRIADAGLPT